MNPRVDYLARHGMGPKDARLWGDALTAAVEHSDPGALRIAVDGVMLLEMWTLITKAYGPEKTSPAFAPLPSFFQLPTNEVQIF